MSEYNSKYTVNMVSFSNLEHGSAYKTLMRGQTPQEWQIRELERFVEELKQGPDQCGGLL